MRRLKNFLTDFRTRVFASMVLAVVGITTFCVWLSGVMVAHDQHKIDEFHSQCTAQHGRFVELHYNGYCIIDGVKISYR